MYFGQENAANLRGQITASRTFTTEDRGKCDVLGVFDTDLCKYTVAICYSMVSDDIQRNCDIYYGMGWT